MYLSIVHINVVTQGIKHRFHYVIDVARHLSRWEIKQGCRYRVSLCKMALRQNLSTCVNDAGLPLVHRFTALGLKRNWCSGHQKFERKFDFHTH